jgi:hypothetical protein
MITYATIGDNTPPNLDPSAAQGGSEARRSPSASIERAASDVADSALREQNVSQSNPASGFFTKLFTRLKFLGNAQASGSAAPGSYDSQRNGPVEPTGIARVWNAVCNFFSRASRNDEDSASSEEHSRANGASDPKTGYSAERDARNNDVAQFNAAIEAVRKHIKDGLPDEEFNLEEVLAQVPEIHKAVAKQECEKFIGEAVALLKGSSPTEKVNELQEIANGLRECKKPYVSEVKDLTSYVSKKIGDMATFEVSSFSKKILTPITRKFNGSGIVYALFQGGTFKWFAELAAKDVKENKLSKWLNKRIHDGSVHVGFRAVATVAALVLGIATPIVSTVVRAATLVAGFVLQILPTLVILGGIGAGLYFGGSALLAAAGVSTLITSIALIVVTGVLIRNQFELRSIKAKLDQAQISPEQVRNLSESLTYAENAMRPDGDGVDAGGG